MGIGLVQEAIVQFLNTQGDSASQNDIQNSLGLNSSTSTGNVGLVGTLLADLESQNIVQTQGQGIQTKVKLLAAQQGTFGANATAVAR